MRSKDEVVDWTYQFITLRGYLELGLSNIKVRVILVLLYIEEIVPQLMFPKSILMQYDFVIFMFRFNVMFIPQDPLFMVNGWLLI